MIFFLDCREKKNQDKTDSLRDSARESGVLKTVDVSGSLSANRTIADIDTIYPLQVKNKLYQLILSHEGPTYTSQGDLSTTVRIVENENHDTLYKKTFDFNTCGLFANPAPDHYWLDLYNSGGGSGFSGKVFNIKIDSVISLQPLVSFDELSYWKSNRTATAFIFSEAIWNLDVNMDSEDFESHFDKHKQEISIYEIEKDTVIVNDLGLTKNKFDFSDYENKYPLKEFRDKEPAIAKQINWEDYNISE
jgi:hypothetical protein